MCDAHNQGSRNKGNIKHLMSMQHKAAIWIMGVFKTVLARGVEMVVSLPLIYLHLCRLVKRSHTRLHILAANHTFQQIMLGRGGDTALGDSGGDSPCPGLCTVVMESWANSPVLQPGQV